MHSKINRSYLFTCKIGMITFMYPTIINIPPSHNTELKTGRQKSCGPAGNTTDTLLVFTWLATNSTGFDV